VLHHLEEQKSLTTNQWKIFAAATIGDMLDFFEPESPHWLIGKGRLEEARKSIAWALQVDPKGIELPTTAPASDHVSWHELFKYPRSLVVSCLTGVTQTGGVGLTLWLTTLLVLVLKISPAEASFLVI
jgi:putative MFS transporter